MKNVVYVLISPSGKWYVGQAVDLNKRLCSHEKDIKRRCKNGWPLWPIQKAIKKYGMDQFRRYIIPCNSKIWMDFWETTLIAAFNTKNPLFGYNLTDGGDGTAGRVTSSESRERYKLAALRQFANPDQRNKARIAALHRFTNPKEREKNRNNALKQWATPEGYHKGRMNAIRQFADPVQREKARTSALRRWACPEEREKNRIRQREYWNKPENREKARERAARWRAEKKSGQYSFCWKGAS